MVFLVFFSLITGVRNGVHPLSRYLLSPEDGEGESSACQLSEDDLMFNKLMIETRDMIER